MSRVLVTGANGFIGRRVVRTLRLLEHDVVTMGRHGNEDVVVDLFDEPAAQAAARASRASTLVHLAWDVKTPGYHELAENALWLNPSLAIVRGFTQGGGSTVVAAGTCFEYGMGPLLQGADRPFYESDTCIPLNLYGTTKRALYDRLVREFENVARIAWARIFYPYGPGEPPRKLVSYLIDEISAGRVPVLDQPDRVLDYVYADDVAQALCRMAEREVAGPINVGSGTGVTPRQIAERVAFLRRPELLSGVRDEPGAPAVEMPIVADTHRMRELLGSWDFVSLDEGIELMLAR